jgi:Right handed beta helix region
MKRLLGTLFLVLLSTGTASAKTVYVSPDARGPGNGSLGSPFRTLTQARDALRGGPAGGTVILKAGTYYLPRTFVLTARDSGTAEKPVVYEAEAGAKVVISGGMKLELTWKPYKDAICQAKTPAGLSFDQLFVNDQRQQMARYPNYDPNVRPYNGFAADAFSPQRAARWADPAGGYIHAMHIHLWGDYQYLITGKKPNNEVTYVGGWQNNRLMGMHPKYRFVENIFEELDAPGEWFHNAKTNTLYYYPPEGVDLKTATFEVTRLDHLIELNGSRQMSVKHIIFKGLTFGHANRTFMKTYEPLLRSDWRIYRGGAVWIKGAEDCAIEDCEFDQVGGNAVFVNNYNRRITISGSHFHGIGASGICFIGDPNAVRNPCFEYHQTNSYDKIDKTPGPKTDNYPADCLVEDCLIHDIGVFEKQTAGVEISMSSRITVRHCSIYDTPRAGINIGTDCWGGHVIEFCDVFDTVLETGDHGNFNSWGRDRYWHLKGAPKEELPELARLDTEKTIIRNSRWRCDHGWDIDLDDGSSEYHIYNNLCLHGGIKNREGFHRVVENNIMVDNTFHPHVWFENSDDAFRRNIVFKPYGPIRVPKPWGKQVDYNLLYAPGQTEPQPAVKLQELSGRDEHSIVADAMFVDPASGNYQVKEGSPALKLGFTNFPMDQFGVVSPRLKAIARTPTLPAAKPSVGN